MVSESGDLRAGRSEPERQAVPIAAEQQSAMPRGGEAVARTEALRVDGVSKSFGLVQALCRVSLSVGQGEVVALVETMGRARAH